MILTATGQLEQRPSDSAPWTDDFNSNYNPRDYFGLPDMVCTKADAEKLQKKVSTMPGVAMLTGVGQNGQTSAVTISEVKLAYNDNSLGVEFQSSEVDVHYWIITYNALWNGTTYTFSDVCSDIMIRSVYPDPFEDGNPNAEPGGSHLVLEIDANPGMDVDANLRWANKEPVA
jgi:hypothetical protein